MPDDPQILRRRLDQARARLDAATPYSPEWDAAISHVEELERRLEALGAEVVVAA